MEHDDTAGRLQRTLAMLQMVLDITAMANSAVDLDEALQSSLDTVCAYTGWRLGHVYRCGPPEDPPGRCRIWHLDGPVECETFLRHLESVPVVAGEGVAGRAWAERGVAWGRFTDSDSPSRDEALQAELDMSIAVAAWADDEVFAVLEFFSTPAPAPDPLLLDTLANAGIQIGRMAERLRAEQELAQLNARLVELNHEKNQFIGIASHDLKNPINVIGLSAELIRSGSLGLDETAAVAATIAQEAGRMAQLIKKLLDIEAIESGRFNIRMGPVDLADPIVMVLQKYQEAAAAKGLALGMDLVEEPVIVCTDGEYLLEVLENLVSNALKFMPVGPPGRVMLRLLRTDTEGILEVQDQGPGFSAEDLTRVFGRYAKLSARPTAGEGSTGLGLSIVKRLVEALQGRINLESEPGQGATFRVALPLAEPAPG